LELAGTGQVRRTTISFEGVNVYDHAIESSEDVVKGLCHANHVLPCLELGCDLLSWRGEDHGSEANKNSESEEHLEFWESTKECGGWESTEKIMQGMLERCCC